MEFYTIWHWCYGVMLEPFQDYQFLRKALTCCVAISIVSAPLGVILIHRQMSLMGEALSHGTLPGMAVAYLLTGMYLPNLIFGGAIAGLIVAFLSYLVTQKTTLKEDASFTSFYIIALAIGIMVLSLNEGSLKIMQLLFGNILGVDDESVVLISVVSILSLTILSIVFRPLIYDCFDPSFTHSLINKKLYNFIFLSLVVTNLVASYQALGTLMALGIMMIPAVTARLLSNDLSKIFTLSAIIAIISSYVGLLMSYHFNLPSGPAIILTAGCVYIFSLIYYIANKNHSCS